MEENFFTHHNSCGKKILVAGNCFAARRNLIGGFEQKQSQSLGGGDAVTYIYLNRFHVPFSEILIN